MLMETLSLVMMFYDDDKEYLPCQVHDINLHANFIEGFGAGIDIM